MKVAILFANPRKKWTAALARLFTGTYAYHCGFYDPEDGTFFDISVHPRAIAWRDYVAGRKWIDAIAFDVEIAREDCDRFLHADSGIGYSFADYFLFAMRPIFHLFGREAKNAGGAICSELVNDWLWRSGNPTPFSPRDEPPSPTDLFLWLSTTGRRIANE